ncbi:hypothetical protein AGMMS49938_15920 [Fibrobacterales bacterium]|nr:hypothetical protein AGMMS49938_15920 [Fibrobacterales bacterium]
MESFLKSIAYGARSFTFIPTMHSVDDKEPLLNSGVSNFKVRQPIDFIKSAWDNTGKHLQNAMNEVEKNYGKSAN